MINKESVGDFVGIRKGLKGQSLGELEAQIMDIFWDIEPPVSTTQVFKIMYPRRELSYSTIMLTMAKLARKGILTQEKTGTKKTDAFVYHSNISRAQMTVSLLNAVSHQILGKPLDEGIALLCGGKVDAKGIEKVKELVAHDEAVKV
ncbi:MAG: BlaI/MecI/CopY family transcriptional regulator [Armatimonadota bacterium]